MASQKENSRFSRDYIRELTLPNNLQETNTLLQLVTVLWDAGSSYPNLTCMAKQEMQKAVSKKQAKNKLQCTVATTNCHNSPQKQVHTSVKAKRCLEVSDEVWKEGGQRARWQSSCKWSSQQHWKLFFRSQLHPFTNLYVCFKVRFNVCKMNWTKCYLPPSLPPAALSSGPSSGFPCSSGASASHLPAPHEAEAWLLPLPHFAGVPHQLEKRNRSDERDLPSLLPAVIFLPVNFFMHGRRYVPSYFAMIKWNHALELSYFCTVLCAMQILSWQ